MITNEAIEKTKRALAVYKKEIKRSLAKVVQAKAAVRVAESRFQRRLYEAVDRIVPIEEEHLHVLGKIRLQAREEGVYSIADAIRTEVERRGYTIRDTDGTVDPGFIILRKIYLIKGDMP